MSAQASDGGQVTQDTPMRRRIYAGDSSPSRPSFSISGHHPDKSIEHHVQFNSLVISRNDSIA